MTSTDASPSPRWRSLQAMRGQLRVIAALVLRETRVHFGERRLGYLWAVIEPCLHLIAYALVFTYLLRRSSPLGGNVVLFFYSGLIPYFLYVKLATYLAGAVDGNRSLLNLPPVKIIDVFVARAILETATYLFVAFLLFAGMALAGVSDTAPQKPIQLFAVVAGVTTLGFGFGLINAVLRVFMRNWTTIFGIVLTPMFLLSGIWFLPSQVPPPLREYLLYNPLMHYIMWSRCGFYAEYNPPELDRNYAIGWSVVAAILGLTLVRVARRRLLDPV